VSVGRVIRQGRSELSGLGFRGLIRLYQMANPRDLLLVVQQIIDHGLPYLLQDPENRCVEIVQQALRRVFMALTLIEAPVSVFQKRGIFKCLYRCQQHIDQVVMKPVVLVCDKSQQMHVNIAVGSAA
jgi:hypothetical protein